MADGKALRDIPELGGKKYATGDKIPAAVISKITPQVLRVLVDNRHIEVSGMEPAGKAGAGSLQHFTARLDSHSDQIKALLKGREEDAKTIAALGTRLAALESGKPAKAAKSAKAK